MTSSRWSTYKLGDLVESISVKHKFDKTKLIFLNTSDVLNGKILHHNYSDVNTFPGQAKKSIQKGDILFSEIRPKNRRFALIDFDSKDYVVSTKLMVLRKKSELIDNDYLYLYLTSQRTLYYLQTIAEGRSGTFPQITFKELSNISIQLPSIEEQRAIANTLTILDKKIETNNQINEKLEEMAQALFKQWFVDFEFPNKNSEPYKSSGGEMVESELGMIPKGWVVSNFRSFISNILGGDWGKEKEQGNYSKPVYCLRGADIPEVRNGKLGKPPKRYILEKNYKNKKLTSGNLVVEISGGSPTQSTGRVTYIDELLLDKFNLDLVCTNFCRAITLNNPDHTFFIYYYWKMLYDLNVFFQYENGTTGIKNLDINSFLDTFKIVRPSEEILDKFKVIISSFINNVQMTGNENNKLSQMRDILLSKLMSGEIRVPLDTEVLVEKN